MTTYYIAESQKNAHITQSHWEATTAKTLTYAKIAATKAQYIQGTSVHVAVKTSDGNYKRIATKAYGQQWEEF